MEMNIDAGGHHLPSSKEDFEKTIFSAVGTVTIISNNTHRNSVLNLHINVLVIPQALFYLSGPST
jgi:hypothetical protein